MNELEKPDVIIDVSQLSSGELTESIRAVEFIEDDVEAIQPLIQLTGVAGQASFGMRWDRPVRIQAKGDLGHYAFAYCGGPDIQLHGNAGNGTGEGLRRGFIRIAGNAGCGIGTGMTGGTLAVYGSVGNRAGAAIQGGNLFVRGHAGDDAGIGGLSGSIVIGGNAGHRLGDRLSGATIFLRGKAESLAEGMTEVPLRKREEVRLGILLMSAAIRGSAAEFRRVIPLTRLQAEQAATGEITPNWR